MSKMLIVVGAIVLVCIVIGYFKGFIRFAVTLGVSFAGMLLVALISPMVSNVLLKTTPIESVVQKKCDTLFKDFMQDGQEETIEEMDYSREKQINLLENAKIPQVFKERLLENNNEEIYETLGVGKFSEYIGAYLAKLIADIAGFLLSILLVGIVVILILCSSKIIEKLPVVGGLNRMGGAMIGAGVGIVLVWILFIVITLSYETQIGKECLESIEGNVILKKLYEHNILMNYITKFRG